ncbi:hypothetical protein [Photobacterium damselae]|uniref:hypothetical protein n=1 Tax=Photobacterium damselae TaxID=38293 RepID=UPI000D076F86|nr:hypothetical protein [Photobacterium damselae]PSB86698.1 hypothetical protein C5F62_02105 [Photobacterium damselae subsp. damselae]PSB88658.1 hypothetical protein C5F63_07450 [Photobacterium damselae subsp. damselae]UKA31016.1 hypothetical protein IPQ37_19920 [Photobacterium damselae subsp. damselae]SUB90112.1 Uncharacterised protein [Photobacterium damselae]
MNKFFLLASTILLSMLAGYLSYKAAISLCDPDYSHWIDGECQAMPSMLSLITITMTLASPIALMLSVVAFFILKTVKRYLASN